MTSKIGLKRNVIDKFYTSPETVKLCLQKIQEFLDIDKKYDLIIEPSAGNGSFISGLERLCNKCLFLDIEPEDEYNKIVKQDYLSFDIQDITTKKMRSIHVIGNPPFGRQSSTAIKFIKKACEYCDSLSFILPKSFKKPSLTKVFPLNFHMECCLDLPKNSFIVNEKEHDVPCVFQIWKKKDYNRHVQEKLEPINFQFVSNDENPDISFRRVGIYAGKVDTVIQDKSIQSHYFIKLKNNNSDIIEKLKNLNFEYDNTVGPKSISKQEVIQKFNDIMCEQDDKLIFTQSQRHGFIIEGEIRKKVFGLEPNKNDTNKFDIQMLQNKFNCSENISIKSTCQNYVDCADILRFYDSFNLNTTMIIIKYKQQGKIKQITETIELKLNNDLKKIFFGNIPRQVLEEYNKYVKSIPKNKPVTDTYYKLRKKELQDIYQMKFFAISPKVDSTQRRVQCRIPNLNKLIKTHPEFVVCVNKGSVIRGIEIEKNYVSGPRKRNKKY